MGEEHAAALMEWLPDGPLASKADIDHLREIMDIRWERTATKEDLAAVEIRVAKLAVEVQKGFTRQTWGLVTAFAALNGLALAAARVV